MMFSRAIVPILCACAAWSASPAGAIDVRDVWPDEGRHQGFGEPYFGDLDGDGDLDVVLVHHGEGVYVWRNDGGEQWTEVTPAVFAEVKDPHGAALGDADGDGDLDVFVSKGGGLGKLLGKKADPFFRNEGGFRFTDVTEEAGTQNTDGRGRSPLWFDHDGDGDLDLLILNLQSPHVLLRNDGGSFTDITAGSGLDQVHTKLFIRHPVDLDGDGDMDLILGGQVPDAFLENRGGSFVDRTARVGLGQAAGASTFAMADYDRDGDLDLFVARNWSDKKRQVAWDAEHIAFADKRGGVTPGLDFDATGSLRFRLFGNSDPAGGAIFLGAGKARVNEHDFVLDPIDPRLSGAPSIQPDASPAYFIWRAGGLWHIRWNETKKPPYVYGEIHATSGEIRDVQKVDIPPPIVPSYRDTLYRNDNGVFHDVTDQAGIPSRNTDRSPGACWADFDGDGWLDLYIVRAGLRVVGDAPDLLLLNRGDGTFRDVSRVVPSGKSGSDVGNGEGASAADVNGDGRPDLFVMWGQAEPEPGMGIDRLFLNPVRGRRILLDLRPRESNPQAFGTSIRVRAGGRTELREYWGFAGGTSYGQSAVMPIHFGLDAAVAEEVEITWPSGEIQKIFNAPAGARLVVHEGSGIEVLPGPEWSEELPERPREVEELR